MSKCRCCVPSRFGQASREQSLISVITRILIGMIKRIEMYGRSSTGAVYDSRQPCTRSTPFTKLLQPIPQWKMLGVFSLN
jgi:hypothetical protein